MPTGDNEEGIFTRGAAHDGNGDIILYCGAMASFALGSVNDDVKVAKSSNGFNFSNMSGNPVLNHGNSSVWGWGDEIDPLGAFRENGNWFMYYSGRARLFRKGAQVGLRVGSWFAAHLPGALTSKLAPRSNPSQLSSAVQTYSFSNFGFTALNTASATVFLDESAGKWFLYYVDTSGRIRAKTASVAGSSGGGGILNDGGMLTLIDSTVSNNTSWRGGGIFGESNLTRSTVSGNSARLLW